MVLTRRPNENGPPSILKTALAWRIPPIVGTRGGLSSVADALKQAARLSCRQSTAAHAPRDLIRSEEQSEGQCATRAALQEGRADTSNHQYRCRHADVQDIKIIRREYQATECARRPDR